MRANKIRYLINKLWLLPCEFSWVFFFCPFKILAMNCFKLSFLVLRLKRLETPSLYILIVVLCQTEIYYFFSPGEMVHYMIFSKKVVYRILCICTYLLFKNSLTLLVWRAIWVAQIYLLQEGNFSPHYLKFWILCDIPSWKCLLFNMP